MTVSRQATSLLPSGKILERCAAVTVPTLLSLLTTTAIWWAKQGVRNVQEKTNQHNQALQFHKHVHIKLSGKAMSRSLIENRAGGRKTLSKRGEEPRKKTSGLSGI